MLYGIEVVPVNRTAMRELEDAHRVNANIVQGLPTSVPKPTSLAAVGWVSIESKNCNYEVKFSI